MILDMVATSSAEDILTEFGGGGIYLGKVYDGGYCMRGALIRGTRNQVITLITCTIIN